jgi:inositol transport system substrate-binding protein
LSRIVHLVTADDYTHISISFDKSLQPLYSSSRKNGETIFPAGPCKEQLQGGYYSKHPEIPCALYELYVDDEVYNMAKAEAKQIISNSDDYHYNIIGLILCQFKIPFHRKGYFFCSEFVSEVLCRSKALNLPKDTSLMRPVDFMCISELVCRYRGQLSNLINDHVYDSCCETYFSIQRNSSEN